MFKLLGDKKLYPGNSEIKRVYNIVYPILRILRTEVTGKFEYSIGDNIVVISGNEKVFLFQLLSFKKKQNIY